MTAPRTISPLLGRAAELARLDGALDDATAASPRVMLCSGAAGAGKTALLHVFADRATERGATVLWPPAFGRPGAPPYWLWQQVAGLHRPFDSLPRSADSATIVDRLANRMRSISATRPVVLVLDDVDGADSSSLAVLPRVLRALGRSRLLVCCTFESGPPSSEDWVATRSALERAAPTEQLALSGLRAEDVLRLLVSGGVHAPGPDFVERVVTATAGNPLFVVELVRHLAGRGPNRPEEPLPRTLADLVDDRMDTLSESARRVLGAASVLGQSFRVGDLARTLRLPPATCLAAVEESVRVGIIERLSPREAEFRHSLFRAIVEARLPTAERTDLHRRVAEILEEAVGHPSGDHLGVLAYHWAAAAAGGASTEASSWARRAADEAMRTLAYEEAERLYLVALDHAGDLPEVDRAHLLLARGAAGFRSGHLVAAREACARAVEAARRHGSRELLASAALTLEPVGEPAWDGDIHAWCREALADPGHDASTRVRLLARLSQSATYLRLDDEADRTSADALRRAAEINDTDVRVDALTARQLVRCGPDDVEELGELADQMLAIGTSTGRADLEMWGRLWRIDTHWYAGRLSAIGSDIGGLQRCAERAGGPYARWHLLSTRGLLALARAEFGDGQRILNEAVELMARIDHPAVHGASVAIGLLIGHHQGYSAELLDAAAWDFGTDVRWDLFSRLARAFVLVDSGQLDEAAALYHRCGDPASWRLPSRGRLVVLAIGARVASSIGALDDVTKLREWLLPYRGRFVAAGGGGSNFLGPVDLALGRCDAALGHLDAACRDFEAAGTMCRAVGAPGFRVEADTELAAVHTGIGDHAAAALVARRALPMARTLRMTTWADRLASLAALQDQVDPLTAREREVASLVAEGLSNRSIADRLVISERTAQNHVQHILTKLGFINRAQIAAWTIRSHRDE